MVWIKIICNDNLLLCNGSHDRLQAMLNLKNKLLGYQNFCFGENGIFVFPGEQRLQFNEALFLKCQAVAFGIMGLLFLMVGVSHAGNTQSQKYQDDLKRIVKQEVELRAELSQMIKISKARQREPDFSDSEIQTLYKQLSEVLDTKETLLRELNSLEPDEPQHLYELALTHLAKSKLVMLEPATTEEEKNNRLSISEDQKVKCYAIMYVIGPTANPGYLDAHLFLAKSALNSKTTTAEERKTNLRRASVNLDKALILDPENLAALGMKVLVAGETRNFEEARAHLQRLFAVDPFVYPQLCAVNDELGLSVKNEAVLLNAQERLSDEISRMHGPSSDRRIKFVTYLVDSLHRLEKLDAADERVKNEMEEFSTNPAVQRWGERLLSIGQRLRYEEGLRRSNGRLNAENTPELVEYLREAYRLNPNDERTLNLIVGLRRYNVPGIEKISTDIYRPGVRAPASVENLLGTIALSKGDYLEATKKFSKANAKAPGNAEYLNNLAYVYLARPKPDLEQALKLVDKAIESVPDRESGARYLTNLHDTKGKVLLALGKIADADGDKELADNRYSEAAAVFQLALTEAEQSGDDPLMKEKQRKRDLAITQLILDCFEASGQTQQAEVWKDRVKQLQASENKN